jgi:cyclic pyranopterin phosphate synthase
VRNEVEKLIAMLSDIEGIEDLTLTTNGYLLARKAQALKDAGLQRITVSLDSIDDEVFKQMNGRGFGTQRVLEGIEAAEAAGLHPIKINSVVQRGVNDHTIVDLARYFKERGHIVRFIEYMDVGNINGWKLDEVVPASEIISRIDAEMPLEPAESNYRGEVANRYRYKDGQGEIGVIASVTMPFCGDCTRMRLSSDGMIFTCLFASTGTDLRGPMRNGASDEEIAAVVSRAWGMRTDRYSELRTLETPGQRKKVEMYHIGG